MTVSLMQVLQCLAFAAPAGLLMWLAGRDIGKALRMRRWPRVEGEIRDVRTRGGTRHTSKIDVKMAYTYKGRSFVKWCISPTRAGYSSRQAGDAGALQTLVETFTPGDKRTVIVNPDTPAEAYIRMPEPTIIIGMLLASCILLAFAVSMLIFPA